LFSVPTKRVQSNLNPIEEEAGSESEEAVLSVPQSGSSERQTRKRKQGVQADAQLAEVLAKSLKWRQEKDDSLEKDPDRLFLLSLLEDFKKVPINKKAAVKIAIIKAIDDGTIEHPYRPPFEPINYPPPTPVQNTSLHYGTDNYYGPSPSTSSASQNRSNVHHTPPHISSQTQAHSRFRYASHPESVATPSPLTPTDSACDDSILSEGSITDLF
jgi:hypothetical protein